MKCSLRALALLPFLLCSSSVAEDSDDDFHLYMQGRYVYEKHCLVCHGKRGRGDGVLAKGVPVKPRNFRTGIFKFRSTPIGFLPTDDDLRRTIRTGVSGTMMPSFSKLSKRDVEAVIVFLKNLSSRWDDEKRHAKPVSLPKAPGWFAKPDAARLSKGKQLFEQNCLSCHGPHGKGDGPASKGLKDIWENPIKPADLSSPHHKSGKAPVDLFRTVALGLDGTPMIGYLQILGEEKIWSTLAYVRSLEKTKPSASTGQ